MPAIAFLLPSNTIIAECFYFSKKTQRPKKLKFTGLTRKFFYSFYNLSIIPWSAITLAIIMNRKIINEY